MRFGELFQENIKRKKLKDTDAVVFIGMQDVDENATIKTFTELNYSQVKSGFTYFERNDVLVAKITPCFENGKGGFANNIPTDVGFGSTEFHILRARENVDPRYIYFQTKRPRFRNELEGEMVGSAGHRRVPFASIQNYELETKHSEKEQTAIANALSDVDALITSLEKLIAKKRAIKTAAMQQLLTGKKRLPGFEGDWSIISMNTGASLKARIGWQALTTNEYLDQGDFYLVTGTDFKGGRVDWSTCHYVDEWRYNQDRNIQLQNGDVLLTKDGTIGKVGYVDKLDAPATLNSGVFVIRPVKESFHPLFLFYILSSRIFDNFLNRITAGSTITHLYQKDFVTFEFSAPSLNEQEAISEMLSAMDDEIELLQYRLNKTQQLKQGMMQELLTGRIRLV
jgi:type I restriction enzyme S subunit